MISEKNLTDFLHQRGAVGTMMALLCLCSVLAWQSGSVTPVTTDFGWFLPSANLWLPFGPLTALAALASTFLAALLSVYINHRFNVLRSLTSLVATMFLAMQLGIPSILGQLCGGEVLLPVVLVCMMVLFSCYTNQSDRRLIFAIFLVLGTVSATQIAYLAYVLVFWLGLIQMQIFNLRTFLASLLGLVTPLWIAVGFGLIDPSALLHVNPEQLLNPVWNNFDRAEMLQSAICVIITVALGVGFLTANILKILSYNARTRSFNGFYTILFIATVLFMILNFHHFTFYVPLLNMLVAYQIGHFFTYRRQKRTYIPLLLIMLVYAALFTWSTNS